MAITAAVGYTQALEGSEAGAQAAQMALNQIGRAPVIMGFVVASYDYPIQQVLHGVSSLLGSTPLMGFSSAATLALEGQRQRAVAVALVAGSDIHASAGWWQSVVDDGPASSEAQTVTKLIHELGITAPEGLLLMVADGLGSNAASVARQICARFETGQGQNGSPGSQMLVAGALASGELRRGRTYQIGGQQSGSGGLAVGYLKGNLAVGVGTGHGWSSVGNYFKVTRSTGLWLRTLDGRSPADAYARLFGFRPREWGLPPLNELVRLYPLGIELESHKVENVGLSQQAYLVRSPLRMENDGSLRMNAHVPEGSTGYLLVGSTSQCIEAARQASKQALTALKNAGGNPRPALALVLVDLSWKMLMQAQPGEEIKAVAGVLGKSVPVIGGYTFGQLARNSTSCEPELLNQHIQVIVFSEAKKD